jgi:hypothetical protein
MKRFLALFFQSASGSVMGGKSRSASWQNAFRWTVDGGMESILGAIGAGTVPGA